MKLTAEAEDFFGKVRDGLDAAGVAYELDPHLVRGLDYYRHTAFEFVTDRLGAQGTVIAGGRYDGLIEALGGPHTPAVGWAAGIERLAMLIDAPDARTARRRRLSSRTMRAAGGGDGRAAASLRARRAVGSSWSRPAARASGSTARSKKGAREIVVLGFDDGDVTRRRQIVERTRAVRWLDGDRCRVMKSISLDRIVSIEAKKHDLAEAMAAPNLAPDDFVRLSKEYAQIEPVAAAAREVRRLRAELDSADRHCPRRRRRAELREHGGGGAERDRGDAARKPSAHWRCKLLPKDTADERAAMLEVRAGTGGDEAALFAGDLLAHVPALRRGAGLEVRTDQRLGRPTSAATRKRSPRSPAPACSPS